MVKLIPSDEENETERRQRVAAYSNARKDVIESAVRTALRLSGGSIWAGQATNGMRERFLAVVTGGSEDNMCVQVGARRETGFWRLVSDASGSFGPVFQVRLSGERQVDIEVFVTDLLEPVLELAKVFEQLGMSEVTVLRNYESDHGGMWVPGWT